MSQTLIQAHNLAHAFDYQLYTNIDFSLIQAQSIAILGRSGSGKSTLLYNLSSFLPPQDGNVKLFDKDIYSLSDKELAYIRRYDIGMIFQSHYLFKGMSGSENITIATMLSNQEFDHELLKKLQIEYVIDQKISDLSGGQQQRVSIARVLNKKPRIIFADEPTGNLDKATAKLVMGVLLDYVEQNGAGLVLVTHDEEMANLCHNIYRLEDKALEKIK
ncbi:MAG: ATP-binding cassette domain-containing protein [Campylobacterota bacterium]|nr:ATP-binding cassette domain-containing protein [Campylobacterota bacterium]